MQTDPQAPLSAALLKRIAHAVDGVRTGEEVYLVIQATPPYSVVLVTTSGQRAQDRVDQLAGGDKQYRKVGPYTTEVDQPSNPMPPRLCLFRHGPDSDPDAFGRGRDNTVQDCYFMRVADFQTPEEIRRLLDQKGESTLDAVEEITVSWKCGQYDDKGVRTGDGSSNSRVYAWDYAERGDADPMVDSLFFTFASAEGLLFPYLEHVHGPELAKDMRESALKAMG